MKKVILFLFNCCIIVLIIAPTSSSAQSDIVKINSRIYAAGSNTPLDGNVIVYSNNYSNFVDRNDALKLTTSGENFAINHKDTLLVAEGRNIISNKDTLSFTLWNLSIKDYRIEFIPQNLDPGLTALFIDSFLNTVEPLDLHSGTVSKTFTVTSNPASGGGGAFVNRFTILFAQIPPLPVRFISISANRRGTNVEISWKVAEEQGIIKYEVERSADGRYFVMVGSLPATGAESYNLLDRSSISGNSFYRIKSISVDGNVKYTNIAKVFSDNIKSGISVFPNPVEGNQMNLQFVNEKSGRYDIQLVNNTGQIVLKTYTVHAGGNSLRFVEIPPTVAKGTYQLMIIGPEKNRVVQTLFINSTK